MLPLLCGKNVKDENVKKVKQVFLSSYRCSITFRWEVLYYLNINVQNQKEKKVKYLNLHHKRKDNILKDRLNNQVNQKFQILGLPWWHSG